MFSQIKGHSKYISATVVQRGIDGYIEMVQDRIMWGWDSFLMTFMYKPLSGGNGSVGRQMLDEVDRVYSTFITRAVRNPATITAQPGTAFDIRPLLVACIDGPCQKSEQKKVVTTQFNRGLHVHGVLAVPRKCRLKERVEEHFNGRKNKNMYVKRRLLRLDIRRIKETQLYETVDYALKGLKYGYASWDDIVVFPKAHTEQPIN